MSLFLHSDEEGMPFNRKCGKCFCCRQVSPHSRPVSQDNEVFLRVWTSCSNAQRGETTISTTSKYRGPQQFGAAVSIRLDNEIQCFGTHLRLSRVQDVDRNFDGASCLNPDPTQARRCYIYSVLHKALLATTQIIANVIQRSPLRYGTVQYRTREQISSIGVRP